MIAPYKETYHVMPFSQIALFCKLPFLRCLFACCVYASLRTAFLRYAFWRVASLRDAFCVLPFCVMPLCVLPFSVIPFIVMPFLRDMIVAFLVFLPFTMVFFFLPTLTWYISYLTCPFSLLGY